MMISLRLPLLALVLPLAVVQSFAPPSSTSSIPTSITASFVRTSRSIVGGGSMPALKSTVRPSSESSSSGPTSTEDILLRAAEVKRLGLRQEYGCTIKRDGLDFLRTLVWFVFDVSNILFAGLAVLLVLGMLLNIAGYGYFFDDQHQLVVQSLDTIRHDRAMDAEFARLSRETYYAVHHQHQGL
jgi:hypothetical protein